MRSIYRLSVPVFMLMTMIAIGCGPKPIPTIDVTGKVTYKGEPVEGASVNFSPVDAYNGSPAYGTTDAEGNYKIQTQLGAVGKGTTAGDYKITISKTVDVGTGKFETSPEGEKTEILKGQDLLPTKYRFSSSSPFTASIKEGQENKFDFVLE